MLPPRALRSGRLGARIRHRNCETQYLASPGRPSAGREGSLPPASRRLPPASRPLPRTQFDDEPLEQDAWIAARALEIQIGAEDRLDRRPHFPPRDDRELRADCPAQLPQNHLRLTTCVEQQC